MVKGQLEKSPDHRVLPGAKTQPFQAQHSLLVASGPRGQRVLMPLVYPSKLEGSGRSSSTPVNGQVRESFEHPRAASRCNRDRAHGSAAGASEGP